MEAKTYNKHIANPPSMPWRDWIAHGIKTYEGRLLNPQKDWAKMKIGDKIRFYTEDREDLWVEVIDLQKFKDFDDAYEALGFRLIPVLPDKMTGNDVYTKLVGFSMNDIKKYGVVAVGIRVICE